METINATGRRKDSVARVYVDKGSGKMNINGRDHKEYFPTPQLQQILSRPLKVLEATEQYDFKVKVDGGGMSGQARAIQLAIAKAFLRMDPENHQYLKPQGLLTRDPRRVERKKPGKRKARKSVQFSKR